MAWLLTKSPNYVTRSCTCTCFKGELILLLAFVVIESTHAYPSPSAGIIFKWIAVPTVLIARVCSGLLIIRPLSRVSLVLLITAHTGRERKGRLTLGCFQNKRLKFKGFEQVKTINKLILLASVRNELPATDLRDCLKTILVLRISVMKRVILQSQKTLGTCIRGV